MSAALVLALEGWAAAFLLSCAVRWYVFGPFTPETFALSLEAFVLVTVIGLLFSGVSHWFWSLAVYLAKRYMDGSPEYDE